MFVPMVGILYVLLFENRVARAEPQKMYNVKIGLLMPKNNQPLKKKMGFGISAGAVTIALERIHKEHLLDGANFSFVWDWPECNEILSMNKAVDLFVKEMVDVIIGPPCSIGAVVAGILAAGNNKPLLPWAATYAQLVDRERFPTLASTIGTSDSFGRGLSELLDYFHWHRIAILFHDDKSRRKCHYIIDGLQKQLLSGHPNIKAHITVKAADKFLTDNEIDGFLDQLPGAARTIACLDSVADRRRFMLRVLDKGMDTDDYVYVLPDYLPDANETDIWIDYSTTPDNRNGEARKAFEKALIVEFKTLNVLQVHPFKIRVPQIMTEWPFNYSSDLPDEQYGSTYSPFLHDAMYLYALALNKTLEEDKNADPKTRIRDGAVVHQKIRGRKFNGMSGNVVIDQAGMRNPEFVVNGFDNNNEYSVLAVLQMDKPNGQTLALQLPEWRLWANRADGKRPLDHPKCGWIGELCKEQPNTTLFLFIGVAAGMFAFIAIAIVAFLIIRNKQDRKSVV